MPTHVFRIAALLVMGLFAGPAIAEPPACTCENLESLQQEYQNAVYLSSYMLALADHLKAAEIRQADLNTNNPTHRDAGVRVNQASMLAREAYGKANLRLPFATVKGYTGPLEVNMKTDSCSQDDKVLKAMEDGSPCKAIAIATLAHERTHTRICERMGKDNYWRRPPSEIALEEAEMYKLQAASLKADLRKVLGDAEVRLRGEWRHVLAGDGAEITYFYEFESQNLTGDAGAGDRWTLSGEGETRNSIESMVFPGVSCTSAGAVTNAFTVAMDTDGLTFGLEYADRNTGGDMSITCDGGMAMVMPRIGSRGHRYSDVRVPAVREHPRRDGQGERRHVDADSCRTDHATSRRLAERLTSAFGPAD